VQPRIQGGDALPGMQVHGRGQHDSIDVGGQQVLVPEKATLRRDAQVSSQLVEHGRIRVTKRRQHSPSGP
jgi:hypothetical protein